MASHRRQQRGHGGRSPDERRPKSAFSCQVVEAPKLGIAPPAVPEPPQHDPASFMQHFQGMGGYPSTAPATNDAPAMDPGLSRGGSYSRGGDNPMRGLTSMGYPSRAPVSRIEAVKLNRTLDSMLSQMRSISLQPRSQSRLP